jgi:putative hemolysin
MQHRSHARTNRLFHCELPAHTEMGRSLSRQAAPTLEWIFGIDQINDLYDHVAGCTHAEQLDEFLDGILKYLGIRCTVAASDLERVPKSGPLIIVANHPFGALEGILLASVLRRVRPDLRIIANDLLEPVARMRELFLFVDVLGGDDATIRNGSSVRQALRWTRSGGALAVFPAGEVSHFQFKQRQIVDPRWSVGAGKIIRTSSAPVLPVYFSGANGPLFQLAGMVHPRLRTALLPRQLLARRNSRVEMRIGSLIPARKVQELADARSIIDYARQRTYLLQHRNGPLRSARTNLVHAEPIAPPGDAGAIGADVDCLPADQTLLTSGDYRVAFARAPQIPNLLAEIGRLREITFRATGEGTGKARDIDSFDYDYLHLFVWNTVANEIVGGYRVGQTDILLPVKGRQGLYTSTLFDYSNEALRQITPGLELGRSFVATKYQRSYSPLLLLWKGIGQFIVRHPRYKNLFGPVSISNTYQSVSKQLMVRFLRVHHSSPNAGRLVTPRNSFRERRVGGVGDLPSDGEEISSLVAEIEPDQKGIPVLLRQYLKFGAKLLAINVDPQFSDVVDGLLMADLTRTDPTILQRYLGIQGVACFRGYHNQG